MLFSVQFARNGRTSYYMAQIGTCMNHVQSLANYLQMHALHMLAVCHPQKDI